jgi:Zn-dependent metalloprotease
VDYDKNEDWQRWNQLAKKRILMSVEQPTLDVRQTPQAEYFLRPNLMSGGTKVSSLTQQSYETEKSKRTTQTANQEEAEPEFNFFQNIFGDESLDNNEDDKCCNTQEVW